MPDHNTRGDSTLADNTRCDTRPDYNARVDDTPADNTRGDIMQDHNTRGGNTPADNTRGDITPDHSTLMIIIRQTVIYEVIIRLTKMRRLMCRHGSYYPQRLVVARMQFSFAYLWFSTLHSGL